MKRGLIAAGILMAFFISILVAGGVLAQQKTAKDEYVFKVGYGDVKFNHKNHVEKYKLDCKRCHHTGEFKSCKDCHKAKAEGKTLSAKDAFHKDCKGCHDEAKKAKKAAGPTACTQCHVKAKK